jgi:hypothetical protein
MTSATQLTSALGGVYAVEREIGPGGMATVYLATLIRVKPMVCCSITLSLYHSGKRVDQ